MGGTTGHVSLGLAFLIIGLWHLFNSIKHHSLYPKSYTTQPWHPVSKFRHIEPITIMLVTAVFISSELFTQKSTSNIPSKSLPHLEHSIIALSFFVQSLFSILFDKIIINNARNGLVHFLQAVAFGQQLLILHLHSTDHMGVEGQYHFLLQIVTSVSLTTTILAVFCPESFVNSFAKAFSVVFQGVWLVVTGVMLWSPGLMPQGCFLRPETGRVAVLCHGDEALERAKALINIQFGLYLTALTVFSMSLYLIMIRCYCPQHKVEYTPLTKIGEEDMLSRNTMPM